FRSTHQHRRKTEMQSPSIHTARLELRAGNREIYNVPFDDAPALARAMQVHIPGNWPVENYDADPLVWSLQKLEEDPASAPWLLRYFIERESNILIGFGGGAGLPTDGAWTIGYSRPAAVPAARICVRSDGGVDRGGIHASGGGTNHRRNISGAR